MDIVSGLDWASSRMHYDVIVAVKCRFTIGINVSVSDLIKELSGQPVGCDVSLLLDLDICS
jgi:hypothetical protein